MKYPFEPKSTSYIEPGQFWAIPLSNGSYASGVVVAKLTDLHDNKVSTSSFLAALIDWTGEQLPTEDSIREAEILKLGEAHLKAIQTTGGSILGKSSFSFLGDSPRTKTDDIVTMGYSVLKNLAEKKYVTNS
ncbi:Imm26 family immunity protein [Porticoccus sp.]|nr:Imm26 family immunity protein [Porticoccus sp.]|tara:strand:- start:886 stop:1281 length:396 start_codon:yes stop_codon:yes gene_type:complete